MKKTKIVATLGPASQTEAIINSLILSGVDLFRFNMKYNTPEWHNHSIELIRKISKKYKLSTGIIVDIPRTDFKFVVNDFDYVALSYLKNAQEIKMLRSRLNKNHSNAGIIAKIENGKAIANLESIVLESDGIMVARGDLGNETPLKELAYFQKKIINMSRIYNKPVIVATQMLLSMTNSNKPTRAEATDVANAVLDGTDALMLSEESALGKYPIEAVKMMAEIAEYNENINQSKQLIFNDSDTLTGSLLNAAANMIINSKSEIIKAIIIFTKSGNTVKIVSKYRLGVPIIAVSDQVHILKQLSLSFGVIPYYKNFKNSEYKVIDPIFAEIRARFFSNKHVTLLVIHGNNWFDTGSTNQISLKNI